MIVMSTQNFSKCWSTENRRRFIKLKENLDFDEFLAEVGVAQVGIFSNQAEFGAIHQLCSKSLFFPTLFRRFLHMPTYICIDIYSKTLGVAIIEV